MANHAEIYQGATEISDLMDKGKGEEVGERLRSAYLNMCHEDFRKLVHQVNNYEKYRGREGKGIDIKVSADKDNDGLPEVTLVDGKGNSFTDGEEKVVGTRAENEDVNSGLRRRITETASKHPNGNRDWVEQKK